MDIKEIDILGDDVAMHWYYRSKAKAVKKLLRGEPMERILDVGAGSGFFSRSLLSQSHAREAWCVDISYTEDSESTQAGKPVHFRRSIDSVPAEVVLLMDVLEHVDDDIGLLKEYAAKVPANTTFLVSVPAFQWLWSAHDVFLEHKRRYTLPQIEHVAQSAGLQVKRGAYYFGAVFPIAVATRVMKKILKRGTDEPKSQLKKHNPLVNGVLGSLCALELAALQHNRLAGLTAFCLAKTK